MKPDFSEARYNLATALYRSGYSEKAMFHYNILLNDAETPTDLLRAIHKIVDTIITENNLLKKIAEEKDSADLYYQLGLLMLKGEKIQKAVNAFKKAVQLDSRQSRARYRLAVLLTDQGDVDTSIAHYNYLLAHAEELSPDLLADVNNDLGIIYAKRNQYNTAIDYFKNALSLRPDFPEAHNNFGLALISLNKKEEAITHFEKAISIKSDFIDAANNLVQIYNNTRQYDKAVKVLESLLEVSPQSSASISYNISCLYSIRGDLKNAAIWMNKAVDNGFNMENILEGDPDLKNLRSSQYYPALLKRIQKKRLSGI